MNSFIIYVIIMLVITRPYAAYTFRYSELTYLPIHVPDNKAPLLNEEYSNLEFLTNLGKLINFLIQMKTSIMHYIYIAKILFFFFLIENVQTKGNLNYSI